MGEIVKFVCSSHQYGCEEIFKTKQYETIKTFNNMKKWKLSNRLQDYMWGILFTVSAIMWIIVVSLFV